MKQLLLAGLLALPCVARAQSNPLDIGGIGSFISSVAQQARVGTAVSINKQVQGVLFVPYPSFHSADGQTEYAVIGLGADLQGTVNGTALHGAPMITPMVSLTGLSTLATGSNWAQSHMTFASLGVNLELGAGIEPLPVAGTHGKWIVGNQVLGMASLGYKFNGPQGSAARLKARHKALADREELYRP